MRLIVTPAGPRSRGWLRHPGGRVPCALGRSGIAPEKREGDGATPAGIFSLRRVLYRADRGPKPATGLPAAAIDPADGWCDDPEAPGYNRPVRLPCPARAERLWRDDALYDIVVVLGHNDDPVVSGAGSAIFLHVAGPRLAPTEGCVALERADLEALLAAAAPGDVIEVMASDHS